MQWVDPQKRTALFQGIASGDQHGGPTKIAQILFESIETCQQLDVNDVTARYLEWWKADAFDTGPVFDAVFQKVDEGVPRIDVTSRKVIWLFLEQLWLQFVPVLHRLQGRLAGQG